MSATDLLLIPLILFGLVISVMFGYYISNQLSLIDLPTITQQGGATVNQTAVFRGYMETSKGVYQMFDWLGVLIAFMVGVGTFLAGLFIRSHPVFFIIMVFVMITLTMISMFFSNAFESMTAYEPLNSLKSVFPLSVLMFGLMPTLTMGLGILLAIAMYGKDSSGVYYG